jgi:hypothetical protein
MDVVRGVGEASDKVKGAEEDELQYKAHKARASQSNRLCGQGDIGYQRAVFLLASS